MAKAASLEEVFEFCNRVRAIGGANTLEALLPGVPEDPKSCLIANNLNFHCEVNTGFPLSRWRGRWGMFWPITDENVELAHRISVEMELPLWKEGDGHHSSVAVVLPEEIGQVAAAYDDWWSNAGELTETEWLASPFAQYVDPEERSRRSAQIRDDDDERRQW